MSRLVCATIFFALFSNAFQRSLGLTLLLDAPESATISANLTL